MILHWSPRSPFVLKVSMVLHEYGLADKVEQVRSVVPTLDPAHPVFLVNPLGQIPTLVTDQGDVMADSYVICEYLDGLRAVGCPSLFPASANARLDMLNRHAVANGLMDALVKWISERSRPEHAQLQAHIDRHSLKLDKVLKHWEQSAGLWSGRPFDLGDVATAAALKYVDFRFMEREERRRLYPELSEWFDTVSLRDCVSACSLAEG